MDIKALTKPAREDAIAWSEHWSAGNQSSLAQRFFGVYRRNVFARTVRYFTEKYFPSSGLLLEAGSGTSETSMLMDKRGGGRKLIALDIVLPVVERSHPVMDVRVCGDIFHLPFPNNSIDGVWNVGVMEHFTQSEIDQILAEFHRVLKNGGPLILLWPGVDSIPQRILRLIEWVINLAIPRRNAFRFHPAEISQLRSVAEGYQILSRNGFATIEVERGFRSLFAFKVLVGSRVWFRPQNPPVPSGAMKEVF